MNPGRLTQPSSRPKGGKVSDPDEALPDVAADLAISVLRAARVLRFLGEGELSTTHYTSLYMIERYGPITVGELATLESIARPTASAVVQQLEAAGYIVRQYDPGDGRICRVHLSRKGREHVKSSRMHRNLWLTEQLEACLPEEIESLKLATVMLERIGEGPGASETRRTAGSRTRRRR